jgi:hypothetical protein
MKADAEAYLLVACNEHLEPITAELFRTPVPTRGNAHGKPTCD